MFNKKSSGKFIVGILMSLVLVLAVSNEVVAEKKIKINMWLVKGVSPTKTSEYLKKVEEFRAKNPNIEIKVTLFPEDIYRTKILQAIAAGTAPEIMDAPSGLEILQNTGRLSPMPEDLVKWCRKHDYMFDELNNFEGKYYSNMYFLSLPSPYYNVEIWEKAGLGKKDIPKTWSELAKVAKKLTRYDNTGKIVQAGFAFNGRENGIWMDILYQLGGHVWSKDGRSCVFNSPEGIKAFQVLYDLIYVYKVNSPRFLEYREAFGTGKAAITWCHPWFTDYMDTTYPDIKVKRFLNPLPDDRPFGSPKFVTYGRCDAEPFFYIPKSSREKEEAGWKYFELVIKDNECTRRIVDSFGGLPLRKDIRDDPCYKTEWLLAQRREVDTIVYTLLEEHLYYELLNDVAYRILVDREPIKKVLNEAVKEENDFLKTRPLFVGIEKSLGLGR